MLIKSALRDLLSVPYGMISILVISRYAAPPYPAAPDFPPFGGQNKTPRITLFINGSKVSTGYSATACGGKVVAPATKGGMHFLARRAVVRFSCRQRRYKKWRRRRRTSPAQRYYITPEGESPQPACKAKPIIGRTLAAQGRKARRLAQPSRP